MSISTNSNAIACGRAPRTIPCALIFRTPCDSFSGKINPKQAAAQGTAAANEAISDANTFGLGKGGLAPLVEAR